MGELFKGLFDLLKGVSGNNRRGQFFLIIFISILIVGGIWVYAKATGTFPLGQIERRVQLLAQLHELEQSGITQSPELAPIYVEITQELREYDGQVIPSIGIPKPELSNISILYIIGGASFWALMGLITGKNKKLQSAISLFIVGAILAVVINIFFPIPIDWNGFVTGFISQIVMIFVIVFIVIGFRLIFGTPTNNESNSMSSEQQTS